MISPPLYYSFGSECMMIGTDWSGDQWLVEYIISDHVQLIHRKYSSHCLKYIRN